MLCGTIHPARIHDYVERKYRDRETRENISIVILVIICLPAKDRGTQYTKRILPDFLTPRSVIRLDHLIEAAALGVHARTPERVCEILGCLDPRTARRRLADLNDAMKRVTLEISHRRASTPELGAIPQRRPDVTSLDSLHTFYRAEQDAQDRAGRDSSPLPSLEAFLQAAMGKQPEKKPLSCVSHPGRPP